MVKDKIQYGKSIIDYELSYSERKTLGIKVHPDKCVQVIAPINTDSSEIKEKLRTKAAWILRQQDFFLSFHPITPARRYVGGETHLYLGKQYRLKIMLGDKESVKLNGGRLEVTLNDLENKPKIKRLLQSWYKSKADVHFNKLFDDSLHVSEYLYDGAPTLKYRWMEKRWGSCDRNGTIHLNLELIKAPKTCIEYVIIHEMCHLAHLNHSSAFYKLLDKMYPNWGETKDRLERLMV
ncbi:M48 family metallopeptidase [Marivirga sp.]|uniref:M48 family metallopeptidase n=1 Tax=Marivirga sp. TaxID=2018662 RepID=UPI0025FAFFE3|nr:SprT family zinc-dependent metalloprotease [Marivirga sp.]